MNTSRKHVLVLLILFGLFCAFGLYAQSSDTRSYAAVSGKTNKDIVDYFLLCPDIAFARFTSEDPRGFIQVSPPGADSHPQSVDFEFRKSLLVRGKKPNGIDITSVVIDRTNAYIHIDATNWAGRDYPASLTFVFFDRKDGSLIPALTFHHEEMEEIDDSSVFYDLRGGGWRQMKGSEYLPAFSISDFFPLVSLESFKLSEPASELAGRTRWVMDLPEYGTTVRLHPYFYTAEADPKEADSLNAVDERLAEYAYALPWDKVNVRLTAGGIVMREDKAPVTNASTAADFLALLPVWAFDTLSNPLSRASRQQLRDGGASTIALLTVNTRDQVTVNPVESGDTVTTEEATVSPLGSLNGETLVALQQVNGQVLDLSLWVYHKGQGTLEPRALLPKLSWQDFFAPGARPPLSSTPQIDMALEKDTTITASIHTWMNPDFENLRPDYGLSLKWNGTGFTVTKKPS